MLKNNKIIAAICLALAVAGAAVPARADDQAYGTKAEAAQMTGQAVALIDKSGKDAAFAEFDRDGSGYKVKDLYVFVYAPDGTNLYHGVNKTLQGKNMLGMKDPDGKTFIADIIATCKDKGEGWVDYKWLDSRVGKVMPKSSYVKKTKDDLCVGVGAYIR